MNRILVADGDPSIRLLLEEELWGEGYEVVRIESAKDILGLIREHRPDLMIVDVAPGRVQPFDMLWKVRQAAPDLPVILFTAYSLRRHTVEALPIDYYVIKSFDLSMLKLAVKTVLRSRAAACSRLSAPFESPYPAYRAASKQGVADEGDRHGIAD
ncbi:MAG: response regulator [Deltaproteobacteria bacterium]|nr:response regulator [Deltaproteobacteria bacterium]